MPSDPIIASSLARGGAVYAPETEISLLSLATTLLRWRRRIALLALLGAAIGAILGLTSPRLWRTDATVVPQSGSESSGGGLAAAASQFGIRVPSAAGPWGSQAYAELVRTRTILEPIAADTLTVPELGNRHTTVAELLAGPNGSPVERMNSTVRALNGMISTAEIRPLNGIQITVLSRWPSVSVYLTNRLIRQLNEFNVQTRKSQAAAERAFVERQAADAESALRSAEDRLQSFLQSNRGGIIGSPALTFDRERLQRDVTLQQQVYSSLLQSVQDAKMREVRDTPVITVVETPRQPLMPESRGTVKKTAIGLILGAAIGILLALLMRGLNAVRNARGEDAREFFSLLEETKPRMLRRGSH